MPGHLVPYNGRLAQVLPAQGVQQQTHNPDLSVYKRYNNWNVCFLCGFDVEYGNTSLTCPFKMMNHQQAGVHAGERTAIHCGGVWPVHQEDAQGGPTFETEQLTVWGNEYVFSK